MDLLPQSGADTFTNSFFSNQEFSPSEQRLEEHRSRLDDAGKNQGDLEPQSSEIPNKECLGMWICARNFPIPIPAHTYTKGSAYQLAYDFNRNLAESYELPPGVYFVVPSEKLDTNMCRIAPPKLDPDALADKLRFSIEQY